MPSLIDDPDDVNDLENGMLFEESKSAEEQMEYGRMCICYHYEEDHDKSNKQCKVRNCSCRLFKARQED